MRCTLVALVSSTAAALTLLPRPSTSARTPPRHAVPRCQFGDFKLPDFKLPDFKDAGEEPQIPPQSEEANRPPQSPEKKEKNIFESFVDAFTPVEVDRFGNVVEATTPEEDERAKQRIAAAASAGEQKDLGESLFGFFFGAPEEGEIAGIARTGGAPDTYPATKTEFAAPVQGDSAEVAVLRPMLKNTNLEFLPLRLAYDASTHGWSARSWHSKVDKTGPCVVVAQTKGGAYCGGYAPKGFVGVGENRGSIAAFLFTWPDGDTSKAVVKLQKIGGAGLATIDEPETGPRFGSDGFVVRLESGAERMANSKLGPYYEALPGGGRSIFAPGEGTKSQGAIVTELVQLRTYVGVWPEGERIPFDGVIPFAIE